MSLCEFHGETGCTCNEHAQNKIGALESLLSDLQWKMIERNDQLIKANEHLATQEKVIERYKKILDKIETIGNDSEREGMTITQRMKWLSDRFGLHPLSVEHREILEALKEAYTSGIKEGKAVADEYMGKADDMNRRLAEALALGERLKEALMKKNLLAEEKP